MSELIFKIFWLTLQGAGFVVAAWLLIKLIKAELHAMHKVKEPLWELNRKFSGPLDRKIDEIFQILSPRTKYHIQWKRYYERSSIQESEDRLRVEPYLGDETLMYHMGYRAWLDMMPGLFVSFGVLGTFIGLSLGLGGLSHADVNSMKSGIFVLLGGMKAAFLTSIAGILSGFFWSFLDRIVTSRLEKQVDLHSEQLAMLLNPDEEELFLQRMEKMAKHQAEHLKTVLTDALEQAMKPAFEGLQAGIQSQSEIMERQLQVTLKQSADITDKLVDSITGGTKDAIERFDGMVMTTFDMQDRMLTSLNDVVAKFAQTSNVHNEFLSTIQRSTNGLVETMQGSATAFVETLQGSAKTMNDQMLNVVSNLETATEDMRQVSEDMVIIASRLESVQEHVQQMQAIEERLLPQLLNMNNESTNVMKDLLGQSKEHVTQIGNHVHDLNENWKSANQTFHETSRTLRSSVQEWSENIAQKWQAASQAFENTNRTLSTSMKDFAENVDAGLSKTYINFDNTLTEAVRKVRELIEQLNGLYDELIEGAEEIADGVERVATALHPESAEVEAS